MKRIWVQASLQRAVKDDLIIPDNVGNPLFSGRIRDNKVVFLWCNARKRFVGVQTFWSHQEPYEATELIDEGMLFVFKEKMDIRNDQYVFYVVLDLAELDQLFDLPNVLKFGLVYFIFADNGEANGPYYLSPNDSVTHLTGLVEKNRIYLVSKQQTFKEIVRKKTA